MGPLIRFAHAPAYGPGRLGDNPGTYMSWCPDNVDVLSVSWHPGTPITNAADVTAYNNGTDITNGYGLAQLKAASDATGLPMCFPEWSPRYEPPSGPCPVTDLAMVSFDEFLNRQCLHDRLRLPLSSGFPGQERLQWWPGCRPGCRQGSLGALRGPVQGSLERDETPVNGLNPEGALQPSLSKPRTCWASICLLRIRARALHLYARRRFVVGTPPRSRSGE